MVVPIPTAYQPVIRHTTLKTTFTGLQHTLSSAEIPIHQYRGIKYATIPARFRQSKLFTSYRSSTDAIRYGYVPLCLVTWQHLMLICPHKTHLPTTEGQTHRRRTICLLRRRILNAEPEANRVRMPQPEHHLPRWSHAGITHSRHGLDTRVRPSLMSILLRQWISDLIVVVAIVALGRIGYTMGAPWCRAASG